jgi:toxin ParE1/3/4
VGLVRYSPQAREDLLDIWVWVARDKPRVADRLWDHIEERAAMLAHYPELGRARPEIGEDARSIVVERWLVLYRKVPGGVEIVRIVDGARDLGKLGWTEVKGDEEG